MMTSLAYPKRQAQDRLLKIAALVVSILALKQNK
jgi:hypothetical protein